MRKLKVKYFAITILRHHRVIDSGCDILSCSSIKHPDWVLIIYPYGLWRNRMLTSFSWVKDMTKLKAEVVLVNLDDALAGKNSDENDANKRKC